MNCTKCSQKSLFEGFLPRVWISAGPEGLTTCGIRLDALKTRYDAILRSELGDLSSEGLEARRLRGCENYMIGTRVEKLKSLLGLVTQIS